MFKLRALNPKANLVELALQKGVNTVGRYPPNSCPINDESVSLSHCVIHIGDSAVLVSDLGSTNGTRINGTPIQRSVLLPGQVLQVGSVDLLCVHLPDEEIDVLQFQRRTPSAGTGGSIRLASSAGRRAAPVSLGAHQPSLNTGSTIRLQQETGPVLKLQVMQEGVSLGESVLQSGMNTIGRLPQSTFFVPDHSVSRNHCTIRVTDSTVVVNDLGSLNGTRVDGYPVECASLSPGQVLQIGAVELMLVQQQPPPPPSSASIVGPPPASRVPETPAAVPAPQPALEGGDCCKNHRDLAATLICKQCRNMYCGSCVAAAQINPKARKHCPCCGGTIVGLADHKREVEAREARERMTLWERLPWIFKYPFGKGGPLLLGAGTAFYFVLDAIKDIASKLPTGGSLVNLVTVLGTGYLFGYMQNIIADSSDDRERLPDWPDFSDWWNDIRRPFTLLMFTCFVSFGPALAFFGWARWHEVDPDLLTLNTLIAAGAFYLPMALLAVAISDNFSSLNPFVVIPAIWKTGKDYLIAAGLFLLMVGVSFGLRALLEAISPIPIVHLLLGDFVALYLVIVEMCLLGQFYYVHRKRLGWYERPSAGK